MRIEKCRTPQTWVKLLLHCDRALGTSSRPTVGPMRAHRQRLRVLQCPTVATNMLVSHLSFLHVPISCSNFLLVLTCSSKSAAVHPFPLSLNLAFTCLCGPTRVQGYKLCGVESSLLSSRLHLIEHDVVYVSIHHLFALVSPFWGRCFTKDDL